MKSPLLLLLPSLISISLLATVSAATTPVPSPSAAAAAAVGDGTFEVNSDAYVRTLQPTLDMVGVLGRGSTPSKSPTIKPTIPPTVTGHLGTKSVGELSLPGVDYDSLGGTMPPKPTPYPTTEEDEDEDEDEPVSISAVIGAAQAAPEMEESGGSRVGVIATAAVAVFGYGVMMVAMLDFR